MDCKIKAPAAVRRMWLVGLGFCLTSPARVAGASRQFSSKFNRPSAVSGRTTLEARLGRRSGEADWRRLRSPRGRTPSASL
jgi:hypothetical protein